MRVGKFTPVIAGVMLVFVMQSAALAVKTYIVSTVINTDDPRSALHHRSFTTIDTETIDCRNPNGCVLVINVVDQINGGGAGGKWAIDVSVDGTYVDGRSRSSQGYEPNYQISGVGNWQNYYRVAAGSHTVLVQTYVDTPAIQRRWSVTIGIGNPS